MRDNKESILGTSLSASRMSELSIGTKLVAKMNLQNVDDSNDE